MLRLPLLFLTGVLLSPSTTVAKRHPRPDRKADGSSVTDGAPPPGGDSSSGIGPIVVQLRRVPARHIQGESRLAKDASFYVGNMSVGTPAQHLEVVFDTSSGHVLLPHKACRSKACLEHHHYSPWASSTAVDVNSNGESVQKDHRIAEGTVSRSFASIGFTQSDLGTGEAKGVLVREHVCMSACAKGRLACADLAMFAATEEDYAPFGAMPSDGIVGLGLEGLAVGALSSFFPRLMDGSQDMLPEIGFALGAESGEIVFGGRSQTANPSSPIEWFPVARPEDGFWQVDVLSVRAGGKVIDDCDGGCHGIIDSASSHLGVQENRLGRLQAALTSSVNPATGKCRGPVLEFELKGGFAISLPAEDYSSPECKTEFGSLDLPDTPAFHGLGVYSFGTNMLRRYYTAFDWSKPSIGFAPNAGPQALKLAETWDFEDAGIHSAAQEVTI